MTKVLQVVCGFYPRIGGIEQVARDVANALRKNQNIEQKIICFNEDAENGGIVCHRKETVTDKVDGIEVRRCGCIAKVASQLISLTYPGELKRLMKSFDPDIVIFHYPSPYLAAFLLPNLKKKTKLILYWHLDITKQKILGKIFHMQNLKLLKRSDKVVATSAPYIDGSQYLSKFKDKCVVINNSISLERFKTDEITGKTVSEIRKKNTGRTICFGIGRHVPYKGYKYLIDAAKNLDNSFMIYIGGSGPLTDELKEQAKGLENVEFLGKISDSELTAYLTACDIFCFPSITKNEAFGIALAEGMYFGKPAVTFSIPGSGVNYVSLDGATGIECSNGDSKAYAEALKKLADDPELREKYGQAAKQRVLENFTEEIFEKNLMKLIGELNGQEICN